MLKIKSLLVGMLVVLTVLLANIALATPSLAPPALANPEAQMHSVYFVRHFEKAKIQQGTDNQHPSDPPLTAEGEQRALNLAELLAQQPLQTIFSTQYKRTIQTALPTALSHNLSVTYYDPRQLDEFALTLAQLGHDALVVGHSNTTPYLVNTLALQNISLSESDYGDVFVVRFDQSGHVIEFKTGRVNRSQ